RPHTPHAAARSRDPDTCNLQLADLDEVGFPRCKYHLAVRQALTVYLHAALRDEPIRFGRAADESGLLQYLGGDHGPLQALLRNIARERTIPEPGVEFLGGRLCRALAVKALDDFHGEREFHIPRI